MTNIYNNSVVEEDVACPLGCPPNDETVLTGKDLLHGLPGKFRMVKCLSCGLMRTNPRPTPESIGFYYPENYEPYRSTRIEPSTPEITSTFKRISTFIKKGIFNFNTHRTPNIEVGRMLEVGCASGAFLHTMAKRGWQVHGVEFSPSAAAAASKLGYSVSVGPLESAPIPYEPFDLIAGWMVMEHLHDPIAGLSKLRQSAHANTWLVLSIPNTASIDFRLFKEKWYALQLPTHLYHYDPKTLEKVLDAGGWKIEKVFHQRLITNFLVSLGYTLRDKGICDKLTQRLISFPSRPGYWNYVLYPLSFILSLLGHTGRMTVWARVKL